MKIEKADVAVIMGSISDNEIMSHAVSILQELEVSCTCNVISAHRTPERLYEFGRNVASVGIKVIIAGAGGAAHLPGMIASLTHIPVLGVPINTISLKGIDSLYSISQMPKGIPVATFAIGEAGAVNAGLLAAAIVGINNEQIMKNLQKWREKQTASVPYKIKQ
ncbi:MAG: 5-(carboxyamino)imidazole ribonucleotide mutase [Rickettsiaceae bacterium H1]|nr:5-(carboxyamino)imidazole ribonucleotide mutase [Rickettsiaceae bacterium H1]